MANDQKNQKKSFIGLLLVGMTVMMKSTKIIAALKLLKFGKPLITLISMLISAILYGIWLGPWFGVGLVAMIFIHEMGHVIALRIKGYEIRGPVFIPFLGAAIFAPQCDDRDTEAFIGFGGPLLGTAAALGCFGAWYALGQTSQILLLLSYAGIFLNLFNLIPVSPLDGGRVTQAVGSWFKYVGLGLLLVYTIVAKSPALLLLWILVLDSFTELQLWIRPSAAGILTISMGVLMATGYSEQPWYIDIVDCMVATVFSGVLVVKDYGRYERGELPEVDDRAYPTPWIRIRWLGYYLGLALLATYVILIQVEYLPHAVKSGGEQLTAPPSAQIQ